ncbi:MAG TPA: TylF/MycF/NovP-related O-methyltransferase [Segetibacter sp.]|jgi:hypothetical protein
MKFNQEIEDVFVHENNFYATCDNSRIGKFIAHYELYKKVQDLQGAIVECGVFKGMSLIRFATFTKLLSNNSPRAIYGFDTYGEFPETNYEGDKELRSTFINSAGSSSISEKELYALLKKKDIADNVTLIAGDIRSTVPEFAHNNKDLKIALLNLDVDIYEPAVTILEHLFPLVEKGGVVLLDDYNKFPGETKAVNDYFKNRNVNIENFPFSAYPYYIVKNED